MDALPAAGRWVRLEVPAGQVGLEGRTMKGTAFSLYGGRAAWDCAGKSSGLVFDPASSIVLSIARVASGIRLSWPSINGPAYRVSYKTQLSDPNWTPIAAIVNATGSTTSWTESVNAPQRFYVVSPVNWTLASLDHETCWILEPRVGVAQRVTCNKRRPVAATLPHVATFLRSSAVSGTRAGRPA